MTTITKILQKTFTLVLGMMGFFSFAQNTENQNNMKTKTDTTELRKLSEMLKKKEVSKEELKKKAKEMNIPFSGKNNGSYYELQGFDSDGRPMYYTTFSQPNESLLQPTHQPLIKEENKEEKTTKTKKTCKKSKK